MGSSRTSRRWAGSGLVALTVLVTAGCATMPDSGSPEPVDPPSGADQGVQVRVIPVPPRDGQSPRQVLQNFLDASIADEHDYQTAREYLTPEAVKTWQPDTGAVILAATNPDASSGDGDPDHATVVLQSQQIATLDAKRTYRARPEPHYSASFTLINVAKDTGKDPKDAATKAQWRITDLPPVLILNQTNFRNAYQQADRYFFTLPDPSLPPGSPGADQSVLVPDPIFVRRRIDPASTAAAALAEGPSDWLKPAVRSAFDGADSVGNVSTDTSGAVRVQVNGANFQANESQCGQLAAQLYFTLVSLNGPGSIDKVTLTGEHGTCYLGSAQAKTLSWAPGSLTSAANGGGVPYGRNAATGQLIRLDSNAAVAGVLGSANLPATLRPAGGQLGPFAVRRDGQKAAVVSADGKGLYEAPLDDSAKQLGAALVTSQAPSPGQGLSTPSWDGFGGLWVVDRDPANPQVWLIRGNNSRVAVPVDLPTGLTVDSIRISSDGTRAALLLLDPVTKTRSLQIGLVVRVSGVQSAAAIIDLRAIAPQLSDVTSVSWADPDTLLALGKENGGVQQLHYVPTDGSGSATDTALQAVDGMTVVAASEDRADQVLADSKEQDPKDGDTIYQLAGSAPPTWRSYNHSGAVLPAYPG
ncbi:hypothetical protein ABH930_005456 [Kitasatospora sp. GAS204A]|nr:hypothetical protein [Kitasatospora sp. GAS204B]